MKKKKKKGIAADTLTIAKAYRADTLKGPGENTVCTHTHTHAHTCKCA